MARTFDIGSNNEVAATDTIAVGVPAGGITVKNVAGPTLNHHTDLHGPPAYQVTAGNSQTVNSGPLFLKPTGRTTVTLTGSGY